jgi:hypothetical protein
LEKIGDLKKNSIVNSKKIAKLSNPQFFSFYFWKNNQMENFFFSMEKFVCLLSVLITKILKIKKV